MTPSSAVQNERNGLGGYAIPFGYFGLLKLALINANPLPTGRWAKRTNLQNFLFSEDMATVLRSSLRWFAENINRVFFILTFRNIFKVFELVVTAHSVFVVCLQRGRSIKGQQHQEAMNRKLPLRHVPRPITELADYLFAFTYSAFATGLAIGVSGYFAPLFHIPNSSCNKVFAQ